ncbi:hypothetical protein [Kribbella sp. VKM Ac-2568]|uniref:hypothetical protein n=1 Tax=Kribbella sp. VKM Ac-2568 TaxID=2512219 RepID=UPI0010511508|nr:hypothetical protein [Kribbella sp. VKM Ac-2568]
MTTESTTATGAAFSNRDLRHAVASAEPPADCSEAAQAAGECIGWAGAAGADPAAAAIASSLLLGKSAGARKFFDNHRAEISSTTQSLITQAFATETSAGAEAAARVLAPLVFPSPHTFPSDHASTDQRC